MDCFAPPIPSRGFHLSAAYVQLKFGVSTASNQVRLYTRLYGTPSACFQLVTARAQAFIVCIFAKSCASSACVIYYIYVDAHDIMYNYITVKLVNKYPSENRYPSVFTEICCWLQCPESTYPPNIGTPVSWK